MTGGSDQRSMEREMYVIMRMLYRMLHHRARDVGAVDIVRPRWHRRPALLVSYLLLP
jgi:hypothetical protein